MASFEELLSEWAAAFGPEPSDHGDDSGGGMIPSAQKTLAQRLNDGEGEKYAEFKGDGVMPIAHHKAYLDATGENIDGSKPAPERREESARWGGSANPTTYGTRSEFDAQVKLFETRGMKRGDAEKTVQSSWSRQGKVLK